MNSRASLGSTHCSDRTRPETLLRLRKLLIASMAVAAFALLPGSARAVFVVSPNFDDSLEGNISNSFPFNISFTSRSSLRYQQVYGATEFSSISSPMFITQIAFRPDVPSGLGAAFSSTLPSIQINMSTISSAPDALSATFASNVGANDTVVFPQGPLALSSAFAGPGGGPKDFDILINLTTPFLYDPTAGNLLLDVRNFGAGTTTLFDAQNTNGDGVSRAASQNSDGVTDASGITDSAGLVTRFTFSATAPEPSSFVLAAFGLIGLLAWRRRKRS
jgi:MYXO-CTERM domain-containing protein